MLAAAAAEAPLVDEDEVILFLCCFCCSSCSKSWTFSQQVTSEWRISSCHGEEGRRGQHVARVAWRALIAARRVVGDKGANGFVMMEVIMGMRSY